MDLTEFWRQIFYPINNIIEILFAIFIALSTEKFMKELEKTNRLNPFRNLDSFWKHLAYFIIRFFISFIIVFIVVSIIIITIAIVMALIGYLFFQTN